MAINADGHGDYAPAANVAQLASIFFRKRADNRQAGGLVPAQLGAQAICRANLQRAIEASGHALIIGCVGIVLKVLGRTA